MAGYLAHWELRRSPEAKSGYTRSLVAFTNDVRKIVPRDQPIVSLVKGYQPTLSLLRRYDGNRARPADLTPGTWVIAPRNPIGRRTRPRARCLTSSSSARRTSSRAKSRFTASATNT